MAQNTGTARSGGAPGDSNKKHVKPRLCYGVSAFSVRINCKPLPSARMRDISASVALKTASSIAYALPQ